MSKVLVVVLVALLAVSVLIAVAANWTPRPPARYGSGEAVQLDAEAQEVICRARADLAQQLNIAASEIQLDSIQWPTQGGDTYIIRFEVNGETHEYSGRRGELAPTMAPCEQ